MRILTKRERVRAFALAMFVLTASTSSAQKSYTLFESDQVRPLVLSSDGKRLYAVNTADGFLEVFVIANGGLLLNVASVPVGLEPVAVALRNDDEAWVVNHLSDSVSVVDLKAAPPRVVRTLLVGDAPRDIVFAGPTGDRAFITTAHRGQNSPYPDGEYAVEGIGRADVWVFDAGNLGSSLGGMPLTIVTLFGDKPRALAKSPDGSQVYAAVFRSGNQTTSVNEGLVCNGAGPCDGQDARYPGGRPGPETNFQGIASRETGLIVGMNPVTGNWEDELGRNWNPAVRFELPDLDVFVIDANAPVPTELEDQSVSGVGTILFNMLFNPATQKLYVTNTEANNRVRFEGMGNYVDTLGPKPSGDAPSVRGHLHESRISVIDTAGNVSARHLNKHIDYRAVPQPAGTKDASLATPMGMALSPDGSTLYVAGFGSSAIAVYDTAELESDTFTPSPDRMIDLPHGGPSGLVYDPDRDRLYVMARFENVVLAVDAGTGQTVQRAWLHNPEPPSLVQGRPFLYDAKLTGSNGEASCASCHLFGDMDDLAWDLGDPDAAPFANRNPCTFGSLPIICDLENFDPLKGPMTTQSLRGLANSGPMHWRGDRSGANSGGSALDETAAFMAFNAAFPGLIGRDEGELDPGDMLAFTNFALQISYPPNPIRRLDNRLRSAEQRGFDLYTGRNTDAISDCEGCHALDRSSGFFGTDGRSTFENETMEFKVAHLRNAYDKVGMFGTAPTDFAPGLDGSFTGPQVRGFGFLHDGSTARVFDFLGASVFSVDAAERRDLEAFIMAFDSDLAPIVGQQVTVRNGSGQDVLDRLDLLIERALTPFVVPGAGVMTECDLIVKGVVGGASRGWWLQKDGRFLSDNIGEPALSKAELLSFVQVPSQPLTFTCVPPGSGRRMGIDRDGDGTLNANAAACALGASSWLTRKTDRTWLLLSAAFFGLLVWRRRGHPGRPGRRGAATERV